MKVIKELFTAIKEDRDGIRKNLLASAGTLVGTIILGVALSKVADSKTDLVVLEETRVEPQPIAVPYTDPDSV